MHVVGFIIRIYHDARSTERQNRVKITAASLYCPLFEQCYVNILTQNFCYCNWTERREQVRSDTVHRLSSITLQCLLTSRKKVKVKVKQSRYRPGVAQRVPGS